MARIPLFLTLGNLEADGGEHLPLANVCKHATRGARFAARRMTIGAHADAVERLNTLATKEHWPIRADASLSFRHSDLVQLRTLWSGLTASGNLPARFDLTVRLLKPFLSNLVFVEMIFDPEGVRRYRHTYVGSTIITKTGEFTGRTLEEFLPAEGARRWTKCMEAVQEAGHAVRFVARSWLGAGHHVLAEIFTAPLANDGIVAGRLMAVAYFSRKEASGLAADLERP